MGYKKLINMWRKRCIKGGNTPIALLCVNKEGFPVAVTHHDKDLMAKICKHLAESPIKSVTE